MWGAVFFDKDGNKLEADHYCGFDASEDWIEQEFCFRAKANAAEVRFRLHPVSAGLLVQDIAVEEVSRDEVVAWADALWATMPPLGYQPPPGRWDNLPKTSAALRPATNQCGTAALGCDCRGPTAEGRCATRTLRVVMLGDSIVNDAGNSPWETLVERLHPGLRIEVITSVRGGTGCWYYKDEGRVKPYVLDFAPDLVMIGGISHGEDIEATRSVIRQVRTSLPANDSFGVEQLRKSRPPYQQAVPSGGHATPDILLMTGAFGKGRDPRDDPAWMPFIRPGCPTYRSRLMALAAEEGCGFLDLEGAWGAYLLAIDQPYAWLMRDEVHANARGHQLLARILERFFAPTGY